MFLRPDGIAISRTTTRLWTYLVIMAMPNPIRAKQQ